MERGYKKSLKTVCKGCVSQLNMGLTLYNPSRGELKRFLSGSIFFRVSVAQGAYAYLVISPASGIECAYTLLLGWGFGESIVEHNYLEQFRELGGKIWPTRRFASGFEQLEVLENRQAAWGEVLPEISHLHAKYGAVTSEIQDEVVRTSLFAALGRIRGLLVAYINAIEEEMTK